MNAGTIECIVTVILEVLLLRLRKRSPDERSEIQGLSFPHIAPLMRATLLPGRVLLANYCGLYFVGYI